VHVRKATMGRRAGEPAALRARRSSADEEDTGE
jgi:hypothetical protein